MIVPAPIATDRLIVRPVAATDLADLLVVNGSDEVTRYLPYVTWRSMADAEAWWDRTQKTHATGTAVQFVIVLQATDAVIGSCLLFRHEEASQRAEIGYVMGAAHQRGGYMQEALRGLIAAAFGEMGLRLIDAEVDIRNAASINLLRRLGFTQEGVLRQRWVTKGEAKDMAAFGLLKHEWPAAGRVVSSPTADRAPSIGPNDPNALLRRMFDAAIASAQPALCIPPHLPEPPRGRLVVIGAGKATAAMARAVEDHWPGELSGMVVTRYGYGVPCARIEVVEASHPVPDEAGLIAAQRTLALVEGLTPDDLVLCLISGGGSSLWPLPAPGLTLADKQQVNRALLASGATISEMNCVRRHLSAIKGGRLAAACHPARVLTLLISDVPGDDPIDIASGPTVPDPTTCDDALAIIGRYGIAVPEAVVDVLRSGRGESIKPGDPRLARCETRIVATPQRALEAAAAVAREAGVTPYILGDAIEGEARDVAKVMAGIALQVAARGQPLPAPCVLLSGGETTVTIRGRGRGGRNVEFLLALAVALAGRGGVHALAGDTDGVDGQEEIAGACISPDTLARAFALGVKPRQSLDDNDGHGFFEALGDAVVTGPTLTNVNDFRAILIGEPSRD